MDIDELVKQGNFAQIMRECFALLETRHEGVPNAAYKQTVDLRAYLQTLYNTQPKSIRKLPVGLPALAAYAYKFLEDGSTVEAIKAVPSLQFLQHSRELEQVYEPYNADYTTLPISDYLAEADSADTEAIHGGYVSRETLAVLHKGDNPIPRHIHEQYMDIGKQGKSPTVNITMHRASGWTENEKGEWAARMSRYGYMDDLTTPVSEERRAAVQKIINMPRMSGKLQMIYASIDGLSANDPNREKMKQIVKAWEQRHGLKP